MILFIDSGPAAVNTVALLHMDGTNGSTTFTDDTGGTWAANGNAQITTAQSVFGGASMLLDGNGDWLQTPTNSNFNFGTSDFTIEARVRISSLANNFQCIFANGTTSFSPPCRFFIVYGSAAPVVAQRSKFGFGGFLLGTDNALMLSTTAVVVDTWYAVAVARQGNTIRLFVDGVLEASASVTGVSFDFSNTNTRIGSNGWDGISSNLNGNIDELRVSNVARYAASYTPASSPFTLD